MAGSKTDFYEAKVIQHLFESAYTAPEFMVYLVKNL